MCQATGAEMMRGSAILAVRAGVSLVGTFHDQLATGVPLDRLEEQSEVTKACMTQASRALTGVAIGIDENIIRWPNRYSDPKGRGQETWDRTMRMLDELVPA
jgi:hypothetical protein